MPSTIIYRQGDVLLTPFPFTDQSGSKQRIAKQAQIFPTTSTKPIHLVGSIANNFPTYILPKTLEAIAMSTIRLTTAQTVVRFLQNQYSEGDGAEQRFFAGCFGIFGHANVSGMGTERQQYSSSR